MRAQPEPAAGGSRRPHRLFDTQPHDLATAILLNRVAERLDALEAKLERLMHALEAGAVGDWRGR